MLVPGLGSSVLVLPCTDQKVFGENAKPKLSQPAARPSSTWHMPNRVTVHKLTSWELIYWELILWEIDLVGRYHSNAAYARLKSVSVHKPIQINLFRELVGGIEVTLKADGQLRDK